MLIGDELKIGHDPGQHTAYVDSWISILQDHPFEILSAAADAEKILTYLLDIERKRQMEMTAFAEDQKVARQLLVTGDHISYNDTIYKVNESLKNGRFKMEDLGTGQQFILRRDDILYGNLLEAKQNQSAVLTIGAVYPEHAEAKEPEMPAHYHLKR